jgi:hypothetical protein
MNASMGKKIKTEIIPLRGLTTIQFGDTTEQVEFLLGPPEETEVIDPIEEGGFPTLVYYYWDECITFFFNQSAEKPFLIAMETDDLKATLLDERIFKMKPDEIVSLMASQKLFDYEKETEDWGEVRYTWEEWNIDFYFDKNQLSVVNWSAILDAEGKVFIPDEPIRW